MNEKQVKVEMIDFVGTSGETLSIKVLSTTAETFVVSSVAMSESFKALSLEDYKDQDKVYDKFKVGVPVTIAEIKDIASDEIWASCTANGIDIDVVYT